MILFVNVEREEDMHMWTFGRAIIWDTGILESVADDLAETRIDTDGDQVGQASRRTG